MVERIERKACVGGSEEGRVGVRGAGSVDVDF